MTRDELIAALDREWEKLQTAIDGLSESQMTTMPVTEKWTVKDLLAHIAVWESRLVTNLHKIDRGVAPDMSLTPAQIDKLNEQFYAEQKDRALERVLEDLHGVHLALINRVETIPDKTLNDVKKFKWLEGEPLSKFVAEDSFEHYKEHTAEIRARRSSMGLDR